MEADAKAVKRAKPKKLKKSRKAAEYHGLSGTGTDYTVYNLSSGETMLAVAVGFAVGFAAGYCYFNSVAIGVIVGLIAGWKAISIYRNKKFVKRQRELRLQFRDLLESLSNSYTVGATSSRAFHSAYDDMVTEHGKKSYIANEVKLINDMHDNQGYEINELIADFAKRSGLDDIQSFSGVFFVAERGGNVAKVVRETRDMIGDKIEIELEIQTMITGQRNQLNVLAVMPVVMSLLTRSFGDSSTSQSSLTLIVKLIALALFIIAYWLGTKIVDIKV